ncbi:MerR family transcriptional regulator [Actinomyces gaoshouyii]|uniref:Transcriptional regulator n=1 Tax=Actinomyces gaoshouyii TaxID=1960083 RepID=A0A8H9H902_9ACTO|nr:MerR family transcriptional regulator [Actinomyces gaoshouyii]GGO97792.1 transcriptional regulator [Actinomyces gaoshouyii]
MKISEVVEALRAEFPALSVSKLRYLETEGLISPHRIGNGYRRYSQADVARLRFALTAQRDEYLPLGVIRERLEDMDASASAPDPAPVARVVASRGRAVEGADMSLEDLRALTGASEPDINELISVGLIAADARGRFAPQSLRITRLALEAARLGLPLRNLRLVRTSAERAADSIDQATQSARRRSATAAEDSATRLAGLIGELHGELLHLAVRALS